MSIAVELKDVSKKFKIYDRPIDRVTECLSLGSKNCHKDFWALKNLSLAIKKGETLGIMGINGAGKSTLLQLIAGILRPTTGSLAISGRVAALLELGSGFNSEFTGRENIFLNAGVLGFSYKETKSKLGEIIDFADIGEFIDHPVKVYSNGMYLRLAFAIAVCTKPNTLLLDEVMAVGDALFQQKCFEKIRELKKEGRTIIIVSHNTNEIKKMTDRCILIDGGRMAADDSPWRVTELYHKHLNEIRLEKQLSSEEDVSREAISYQTNGESFFTEEVALERIIILDSARRPTIEVRNGDKIEIVVSLRFRKALNSPRVGIFITDLYGNTVAGTSTVWSSVDPGSLRPGRPVAISFRLVANLCPGHYFITARLMEKTRDEIYRTVLKINRASGFSIVGEEKFYGLTDLSLGAELVDSDYGISEGDPEGRKDAQSRIKG